MSRLFNYVGQKFNLTKTEAVVWGLVWIVMPGATPVIVTYVAAKNYLKRKP